VQEARQREPAYPDEAAGQDHARYLTDHLSAAKPFSVSRRAPRAESAIKKLSAVYGQGQK